MYAKKFIVMLAAFFQAGAAGAQDVEATDSLTHELQEIVVSAGQPATRLVGSTLVTVISGTNLAGLGTALDVLGQLPMLRVQDNAVSVVGKNNIEIYIDGRPMRDTEELQRILSSNLKKVELLMAPGAAYESTTGAVLKITTGRNFFDGLSLTDRLDVTKRRRWSAVEYLGLSYRAGDWEMFVDGSVNHNNSLAKGSTRNTFVYEGRETVVGGSQHNSYPVTAGVVKAGFNYARGRQALGAYYRFNPERGDFCNTGTEWLDDTPPVSRRIDKRIRAHSHLVSAYYENTFADRFVLHADGDFRRSEERNGVSTVYPESVDSEVSSTDRRISTLLAGKLYLDFPLWSGDFTVGTQDSYTRTSLDFRMLNDRVGDYIPSKLTDARQVSAALFAKWSRVFGRFSLAAGARYEYVDYEFMVDGRRDGDVSRRDHLLTPDISVGYSFENDVRMNLSYKMATVRPPYSQLTGSLNYVGLHEIEGGNPALRDERMHDVQLFGMWKDLIVQADFVSSKNTYAYVKQLYPAGNLQLLMHPVNIDVAALSVYLVWSRPVWRWTPNVTAGFYRQWLDFAGTHYNKPIFSYYFDNTFSLPGGWTVTANISGRTQGDMHTNRFGDTWFTMDASVGKTFLGKSLTVKLSATDIFNTASNNWTMNTCGVFVDKRQSYDHRGISLSVIYDFQPRKSGYKGSAAAEAEINRL